MTLRRQNRKSDFEPEFWIVTELFFIFRAHFGPKISIFGEISQKMTLTKFKILGRKFQVLTKIYAFKQI